VRTPGSRWLLFAFILTVHAVLILLAQGRLILVPRTAEQPLLIFSVTRPPQPVVPRPPLAATHARVRSRSPVAASPLGSDPVLEATALPRSPLDIDWSAEAALAAQHQTELATAAGPRSLDDHHGRKPRAGLNSGGSEQFAWDYAATHRVEVSQGVPIIHLGDRCVVGFLLILPFFGCGFGAEIPANGDLFKHLHDPH
jgi:hypothetical protein